MNSSAILNFYARLINDKGISMKRIMKSNFYHNQVVPLAESLAKEFKVDKDFSFKASNAIYVVAKYENNWTIMLPYYNSDVIEYYREHPPQDITEYLKNK